MRENQVKEYISDSFIRLLMAKNRFKVLTSTMGDDGVDMTITNVDKRNRKVGSSFSDSGKMLNIQLKCTTLKQVKITPNGYTYKLKVKNYEDLIYARDQNYTKMILIVFILPDKEDDWMEINEDYIRLCKHAFWYFPSNDETLACTEFKDPRLKMSIELIKTNRLELDFSKIFNFFYADECSPKTT